MPYAAEDKISQEPLVGGIRITDEQYSEALLGMLDGKVVSVAGGFTVSYPEPEPVPEPPVVEDSSPEPIDLVARMEQLLHEVESLRVLISQG